MTIAINRFSAKTDTWTGEANGSRVRVKGRGIYADVTIGKDKYVYDFLQNVVLDQRKAVVNVAETHAIVVRLIDLCNNYNTRASRHMNANAFR
mgnify:CR=1 FL=1